MRRIKIISRCGAALLIMLYMLYQTASALSSPDIQAPTAPEKSTADNITHTAISLSWRSSYDNRSVKGYQVYRDGKKIISTTKTTYTNKDLVPGMQYTYFIKAYDKAGNYSEQSNSISVNTTLDKTAPSSPGKLKATSVTVTEVNLTRSPASDNVKVKGYDIIRNGIRSAQQLKQATSTRTWFPGKNTPIRLEHTIFPVICQTAALPLKLPP